ncbi:hypothetical protein FIU97_19820 (plasmid) [Roseivivax sp. THAF40]|nr:hypothetical protein FIU97_19820 [Roseivivax sp. THAF40]QFT65031.1 hypothetical protein FIU91_18985 [Roseivivax sp. THAF30]
MEYPQRRALRKGFLKPPTAHWLLGAPAMTCCRYFKEFSSVTVRFAAERKAAHRLENCLRRQSLTAANSAMRGLQAVRCCAMSHLILRLAQSRREGSGEMPSEAPKPFRCANCGLKTKRHLASARKGCSRCGTLNSPEFLRRPRSSVSAAARTREATAFRSARACASGCRTSRCSRTRLAWLPLVCGSCAA